MTKTARLSRALGLLALVALLTGAIWPRRATEEEGGTPLCSTLTSQLTWCLGFEMDSTADTCDAEEGYPNGGTVDGGIGLRNCENPTEGTTADVGQPEGDEDYYKPAGSSNTTVSWESQFTSPGAVTYTRFCFYGTDATEGEQDILWPKVGSANWLGSGWNGKVRWDSTNEQIKIRCPTEGGGNYTSYVAIAGNAWHQITVLWDSTDAAAPECSLWVDKDSSGAADATSSGSGMVTGPGNIDGYTTASYGDAMEYHFDMLQVDDTETDLVDVFGNDCQE